MYEYLKAHGRARVAIKKIGGGLGDSLQLDYSVEFLKREFPQADIHVYYGTREEAEYFDGKLAAWFPRKEYDCVVDVSSCCVSYERPGATPRSRIDIYKDKLGCPAICWPRIPMSPVYVPGEFITLHVNSKDPNRSWSEDNYLKLIRRFPQETFVVLDDQYTLAEVAFLIDASKLFIGPDSMPMHLAGVLQRRSIVLFGPSVPDTQLTHYPSHEAIVDPECQHCWHQECLLKRNCINRIQVDTVSARLEEVLAEI